jgi:hypothetical protein
MAANFSRVVFDLSGNPRMIVHPDTDTELLDPAFSPQGTVGANVPFRAWATEREMLVLCQPAIAQQNALAGLGITARIAAIDAAAQAPVVIDLP